MSRSHITMDLSLVENIKIEIQRYIDEHSCSWFKRKGVNRARKYLATLNADPNYTCYIGDYLSTSKNGPLGNSTELRNRIGEVIRMRNQLNQNDILSASFALKLKQSLNDENPKLGNDLLLDPLLMELVKYKKILKGVLAEDKSGENDEKKSSGIEYSELFSSILQRLLTLKENLKKSLTVREEEIKPQTNDLLFRRLSKKLLDIQDELQKNPKHNSTQITAILEKRLHRLLYLSLNELLEPMLNTKLAAILDDRRVEHQKKLAERFDKEFEEIVHNQVMANAHAKSPISRDEVHFMFISRYLLIDGYLPSEDRHLGRVMDTLRGRLENQIKLYQLVDNPQPRGRLWDGGGLGRDRAVTYLKEIKDLNEEELLVKMLRDFMYFDKRSALGSSVKLRERIGNAICRHMDILGGLMEMRINGDLSLNLFNECYLYKHRETCKFFQNKIQKKIEMLKGELGENIDSIVLNQAQIRTKNTLKMYMRVLEKIVEPEKLPSLSFKL